MRRRIQLIYPRWAGMLLHPITLTSLCFLTSPRNYPVLTGTQNSHQGKNWLRGRLFRGSMQKNLRRYMRFINFLRLIPFLKRMWITLFRVERLSLLMNLQEGLCLEDDTQMAFTRHLRQRKGLLLKGKPRPSQP